ncbi:hypothetical protein ACFL35_10910 [Candidatus Riflebacteria bacterium]
MKKYFILLIFSFCLTIQSSGVAKFPVGNMFLDNREDVFAYFNYLTFKYWQNKDRGSSDFQEKYLELLAYYEQNFLRDALKARSLKKAKPRLEQFLIFLNAVHVDYPLEDFAAWKKRLISRRPKEQLKSAQRNIRNFLRCLFNMARLRRLGREKEQEHLRGMQKYLLQLITYQISTELEGIEVEKIEEAALLIYSQLNLLAKQMLKDIDPFKKLLFQFFFLHTQKNYCPEIKEFTAALALLGGNLAHFIPTKVQFSIKKKSRKWLANRIKEKNIEIPLNLERAVEKKIERSLSMEYAVDEIGDGMDPSEPVPRGNLWKLVNKWKGRKRANVKELDTYSYLRKLYKREGKEFRLILKNENVLKKTPQLLGKRGLGSPFQGEEQPKTKGDNSILKGKETNSLQNEKQWSKPKEDRARLFFGAPDDYSESDSKKKR